MRKIRTININDRIFYFPFLCCLPRCMRFVPLLLAHLKCQIMLYVGRSVVRQLFVAHLVVISRKLSKIDRRKR